MGEMYADGLAVFDEYYLMHYGRGHDENPPGRGSGRYAYGTGKKWEIKSIKDRIKEHQRVKAAKKLAEQRKAEKIDRAQKQFNKEQVMKSGSREEVMANAKYLTNDELKQAIERVNTMERFAKSDPAVEAAKTTFDKVNSAMGKAKQVSDWMNTGINLWNNMAKLNNTFNPGHPMIQINGTSMVSQMKALRNPNTQQQNQQNNQQQGKKQ